MGKVVLRDCLNAAAFSVGAQWPGYRGHDDHEFPAPAKEDPVGGDILEAIINYLLEKGLR